MQTNRNSQTTSTKCQYPGGRLEAKLPFGGELIGAGAEPANRQKTRADDDVEPMEAGREEKHRGVDAAGEREGRVGILDRLTRRERQAEEDGQAEAIDQDLLIALQQRVMGEGDGAAGQQQDHRVEQRQMERIEGVNRRRRPYRHDRCPGYPGRTRS